MNKSLLCLSITSALALTGCGAGEEPYKELPKDEKQITTAAIEKAGERQYLYIRSVGQAPRYAAAIRGFTQGDPKLVSLAKTENGIQVRQIDRDTIGLDHDSRWQTDINQAPVLTIPGTYIDFKCTEDKWRECINEEQENNDRDLTWDKKRYFIPEFEDAKVSELNIEDLFTFGECVTETEAPRLVRADDWKGYEMDLETGVINFEIEHTYQATMSCINQFYNGSLDNLSFTTTEYISIVALDQLASEGYEAIPYSENEKGTYGYFTSSHQYRDATDSDGVDGYVRTYMNRFNPAKESITYYLSNNFFEAKNKAYLDAANESVTAINIQNKLFNTGFPEIKLEQANEKRHGDLRYSNITLFDQPLDNGLAGYGPSAANPLTGEIISGRVNQYSSNLKQGAVRYYRQVRLDYNRGRLDADTTTALTGVDYGKSNNLDLEQPQPVNKVDTSTIEQPAQGKQTLAAQAITLPALVKDNQEFDELVDYDRDTRNYWSENTMMHLDNVYAEGGSARQLPAGIKDHKIDWKRPELWENQEIGSKLVAFETLPVDLQDELTTKLAAQAFAGTLTHELGHNFGLRHNFSGSTDKDNLFTEEQMAMMDKAFTDAGYPDLTVNAEFSSQMDYNVNRFATTFEPYDLAALRFAYAREVEKKDGEFVSLKEEDAKRREELRKGIVNGETRFGALFNVEQNHELRRYNFCTDGHVTLNSNCNRSDAGGTLEEIADFYIERYEDSYETSNLRHNRQSLYEDHSLNYTVRRKRLFDDIRQFVEDISSMEEVFTSLYGTPDNFIASDCAQKSAAGEDAWYCRYQRPVDHAGKLFLTLMGESDAAVEVTYNWISDDTPALRQSYNFADVLESYRFHSDDLEYKLQPGEVISKYSDSPEALKELIFKSKINSNYQGQLYVGDVKFSGRLLNGIKAPESSPNHPYVNERDVLGVWPDKLLAVRALVSRTTPRSTSSRGYKALVDLPQIEPVFEDMLCKIAMADGTGLTMGDKPLFTQYCGASGELQQYMPNFVDFADQSIEPLPNYARSVARYFGFDTDRSGYPKGKSNLLQMVLRQVDLASQDSDYQGFEKARKWREHVGIHMNDVALEKKAEIAHNGRIYVATSENVLALQLIARIGEVEAFKASADAATLATKLSNGTVGEILDKQLERDYRVLTYLPVL